MLLGCSGVLAPPVRPQEPADGCGQRLAPPAGFGQRGVVLVLGHAEWACGSDSGPWSGHGASLPVSVSTETDRSDEGRKPPQG